MRMVAEARTLRAVASGMAILLLAGGMPAAGGPTRTAPSAAQLTAMREEIGREGGVRLIGAFGQRDVRHAVLDSAGVRSMDWEAEAASRTALFETSDVPHPIPAPIAWSEIEEVKTDHQHKMRGALIGAGIGLGLLMVALAQSDGGEGGAAGAVVTAPLLGGAVGAFIGSLVGSKTIYRAQEIH